MTILAEYLHQQREQHGLDFLHAHGQGLGHQDVRKPIYRQTGEAIRLAKDNPAARDVPRHDGFAVVPGILNAALPEGFVKAVIGVAGNEPHPNLALTADKACAQVLPLLADSIHQAAVFALTFLPDDLIRINPGMPLLHPPGSLGCNCKSGKFTFDFHLLFPFVTSVKDESFIIS